MNVSCPDCRSIFRVDPAKVPPNGVRARCSVCSGVITIPAPSGVTTPTASSPRAPTPAAQSSAPFTPPYTPPPPTNASRTGESPAIPRQRSESGPITATATPPSPSGGMPEFSSPPATPGFVPPRAPGGSGPSAPPFVPGSSSRPPSAPVTSAPSPTPPAAPRPFTGPAAGAPTPTPAPPSARPASPLTTAPAASTSMPPTAQVPRPPMTPPSASPAVSDGGARRPVNPFLSKDPSQRAKRLARALVSDIITYHPAKHAEGLRDGTLKQLFRDEIKKSFEEYIAQVGQQLAEGTTYFQDALNEVLAGGKKIF